MGLSALRTAALALSIGAAVGLAGCSTAADDGPDTGSVTVLAAASLTDVFAALDASPATDDVTATFSFGSSTTLAEQAAQGAPGDVLATADKTAMDVALSQGAVTSDPIEFASNQLVLVVPASNRARIRTLSDLADSQWVRCADEVPCGRLAQEVLGDRANAQALGAARPASLEPDVRGVLAKVTSGEADAGLVYATDAVAAGKQVRTLKIPGAAEHPTSYWIAPLADGNQQAATAWIGALTSAEGNRLLTQAGFGLP